MADNIDNIDILTFHHFQKELVSQLHRVYTNLNDFWKRILFSTISEIFTASSHYSKNIENVLTHEHHKLTAIEETQFVLKNITGIFKYATFSVSNFLMKTHKICKLIVQCSYR